LLHLRIGKYIVELGDEKYTLDAADQLNLGSMLLVHEQERLEAIEVNLSASELSLKLGSLIRMAHYLDKAVSLVKDRDWATCYDLVLDLFTRSSKAEAARGNFEKCERCVTCVLENARHVKDTVCARVARVKILGAKERYQQAIEEARSLLCVLGERVPRVNVITLICERRRAERFLQRRSDRELLELPPMPADLQQISEIMKALAMYGWRCDRRFAAIMFFRLIRFCVRHGNCASTPYAYAGYAIQLVASNQAEKGSHMGQLADTAMIDGGCDPSVVAPLASFVWHMKKPLHACLDPLRSAYYTGLETGCVDFGSLSITLYSIFYFLCGRPLQPFVAEMMRIISQLEVLGQAFAIMELRQKVQIARDLTVKPSSPSVRRYSGMLGNPPKSLYFFTAFCLYVLGEDEMSLQAAQVASFGQLTPGHILVSFARFVEGLVYFSAYRRKRKWEYLRKARRAMKAMTSIAATQAVNCTGMALLLRAEAAASGSASACALDLYIEAIASFTRSGFVHFAAIANERAGEFCNDESMRETFVSRATQLYEAWGAIGKAGQLRELGKRGKKADRGSVETTDVSSLSFCVASPEMP
jgi:hypothetical protein